MGLFDFLKDSGAKVFKGGRSEVQEIVALLNTELGAGITGLGVGFDNGVVSLAGECDSKAIKEKAILLAGNIQGVSRVDGQNLLVQEKEAGEEEPEEETVFYTVKPGDSLSKIAKSHYGDAMKYPVIFEANKEIIKDPNLIYPGQVLRIPAIEE
jgi:nucleoid-associated protein YgaU